MTYVSSGYAGQMRLVAGTLHAAHGVLASPSRDDGAASVRSEQKPDPPKERVDHHGDPLPPEAVARLGTQRFRHEDLVGEFALAADGSRMAAVAGHGLVLWDMATGRPLARFTSEATQGCVALSPDNQTALVGGSDGVVRLLD